MKISVGIPTFNRVEFVVRAVESVLKQSYSDIEIVVSDNASGDTTVSKIRSLNDPRIILLTQSENIGMIGNFNACLKAASGELFLMLSDDDVLEQTALEELSRPLRDPSMQKTVGIVWCPCHILDASGRIKYDTAPGPPSEPGWRLVEELFLGNRGPRLCGILIRRKDAIAVGCYKAAHGPICDTGNWTQIACSYPLAVCINKPLASYRVHHGSVTASRPDAALYQDSAENILRDLLELLRRRGESGAAERIAASGIAHASNITAFVLIQYLGKPGWVRFWFSEMIRSRRYLFSVLAFKRVLRDGWKLLRSA